MYFCVLAKENTCYWETKTLRCSVSSRTHRCSWSTRWTWRCRNWFTWTNWSQGRAWGKRVSRKLWLLMPNEVWYT